MMQTPAVNSHHLRPHPHFGFTPLQPHPTSASSPLLPHPHFGFTPLLTNPHFGLTPTSASPPLQPHPLPLLILLRQRTLDALYIGAVEAGTDKLHLYHKNTTSNSTTCTEHPREFTENHNKSGEVK